jgi:3-deoxy-manno-octulosonate cytidylyltransferase (CMP-KDO synthetase)
MNPAPAVIGIIPARFAATRFPGKPLAKIQNKEMILWVVEGAKRARTLRDVVVATDDDRIFQVVTRAGYRAVMTEPELPSGTDRIFAAIQSLQQTAHQNWDLVVNIQGDEPLITGELIDQLVLPMLKDPGLEMGTLGHSLSADELDSSNCVKVVLNQKGEALYFSRFPIPYSRVRPRDGFFPAALKHIGMYAYRLSFLEKYCVAPQSPLELAEGLEQLRALDMGARIKVVAVQEKSWGVDTPEDLAKIEEILRCQK